MKKGKKKTEVPTRLVPLKRASKPIHLEEGNCPVSKFSFVEVESSTPYKGQGPRKQVYPTKMALPGYKGPIFSGKFESGNVDQVYLRKEYDYEIHISRDPGRTTQWFFFKCSNMAPGKYTFIITGFHRSLEMYHYGIQPVAYSEQKAKKGIGWFKIGENLNFWISVRGAPCEYTLSFTFNVEKRDNMYFAYSYPYTISDLASYLSKAGNKIVASPLVKSTGGLQIPAIFWDADNQKFNKISRAKKAQGDLKPMILITSRMIPGQSNTSYVVEGIIDYFVKARPDIMTSFSILILPMVNVDGVACGFYRPNLTGVDMDTGFSKLSKEELSILKAIDSLAEHRRVLFYLDIRGHCSAWNVWTIGVSHKALPLNEYQSGFPRELAKNSGAVDGDCCQSVSLRDTKPCARRTFHTRYAIPCAYTLEVSLGGTTADGCQFAPPSLRALGASVALSIAGFLGEHAEAFEEAGRRPAPARSEAGRRTARRRTPMARSAARSARMTPQRRPSPKASSVRESPQGRLKRAQSSPKFTPIALKQHKDLE